MSRPWRSLHALSELVFSSKLSVSSMLIRLRSWRKTPRNTCNTAALVQMAACTEKFMELVGSWPHPTARASIPRTPCLLAQAAASFSPLGTPPTAASLYVVGPRQLKGLKLQPFCASYRCSGHPRSLSQIANIPLTELMLLRLMDTHCRQRRLSITGHILICGQKSLL